MNSPRPLSRFRPVPWAAVAACLLLLHTPGRAPGVETPEVRFEKFTLANGLDVILHEDHRLPMVSVNVWYHVGSKNEKPGRTGFAHLFEHMMFQGSSNSDTDYFVPLERIGGQVNGSTNEDRTNYWEDVPSDQLELALWMEADRMGWLLPAMTQEKLDNQRDVVKNEKREGLNAPYGGVTELLPRLVYPGDHPYSHSVIGSMEDLSAATREDVSEFFRLYYAPNNASLCVAGDFDPGQARAWIEKYFAPIPPGAPIDRTERWRPELTSVRRATLRDDVSLPRVYLRWITPAWFEPGDAAMDLLSHVLTGNKTSRLYKTLVYDRQVAQEIYSYQDSKEICGDFAIVATARPGHDLAELERLIEEEIRRVAEKGITREELEHARIAFETSFVRRLDRIGSFGGKADQLNRYNTYCGDPGQFDEDLQRYRDVTAGEVAEAARRYLDPERRVILHVLPQGNLAASAKETDRSRAPAAAATAGFQPPQVQTAELANGIRLCLVERHDLPLIDVYFGVLSGWAADPPERAGTAGMTAALLDEGAGGMSSLQIESAAAAMGALLETESETEGSCVHLNVLREHLEEGLDLAATVLTRPDFPAEELERQRADVLTRNRQEMDQPQALAFRALVRRVFGPEHPYAQPPSGLGTTASITALSREDFVSFHRAHYLPNNSVVVMVGDLTMAEATQQLHRVLGDWKAGSPPARTVPEPRPEEGSRLVLIDRPGAPQSFVLGGQPGMSRSDPDYLAFEIMNTILGGEFSARINMNLREDKGYSYGSYSFPIAGRHGGMFVAMAPVQTQHTKETIAELLKELRDVGSERPITEQEIRDAKTRLQRKYPRDLETMGRVAYTILSLAMNGVSIDEIETRIQRIAGMPAADLARVAREDIDPDSMVFVIVGDRAVVEPGLRDLGLGEIEVVNPGSL